MLMTVLRGDLAVRQSKELVRTFKKMKDYILDNRELIGQRGHVAVFVISDEHRKVIYVPCDVKPFPESELFFGADVLIIGNTAIGETLKDGFVLGAENPLREELFVMNEILELQKKYGIKEIVMTHLEEDWGKSYDDYKQLEEVYPNVRFAYDGMKI